MATIFIRLTHANESHTRFYITLSLRKSAGWAKNRPARPLATSMDIARVGKSFLHALRGLTGGIEESESFSLLSAHNLSHSFVKTSSTEQAMFA